MRSAVLLCALLSSVAFGADRSAEARAYLGKEVTVKNAAFRVAVERNGRYELKGIIDWIPSSYLGKKATVIAVQEKVSPATTPNKVNALGETVSTQSDVEPTFDFVIRFEDGLIAIKAESIGGIQPPERKCSGRWQEVYSSICSSFRWTCGGTN